MLRIGGISLEISRDIRQEIEGIKQDIKTLKNVVLAQTEKQNQSFNEIAKSQEILRNQLEVISRIFFSGAAVTPEMEPFVYKKPAPKADYQEDVTEKEKSVSPETSSSVKEEQKEIIEPIDEASVKIDQAVNQEEIEKEQSEKELLYKESDLSALKSEEINKDKSSSESEQENYYQVKTEQPKQADELEFRIGGIWLNRIAIVLIIIGTAFFLKYAFDNNWVAPITRVIIGVAFGISFLVAGEVFQNKKYGIFAQGLTGGGIAILYFSIFAGYYFFKEQNIIPYPAAMVLMILITATAVILSVKYDSMAIALLGLSGGFLTPFMLATSDKNYFGLFTYLLILNIGILSISYYKKWSLLSALSFFMTEIILFASLSSYFSEIKERFLFSEIFFTIFFIMYLLIPLVYSAVKVEKVTPGQITLLTFNTIFYTIASFIMITSVYSQFNGLFAVLMAVIFFGIGYWFNSINSEDKSALVLLFGTAITFTTLAVPLQMYKYTVFDFITMGWVVESIILLYASFKIESSKMRKAAVIIMSITALKFFMFGISGFYLGEVTSGGNYLPILNKWSIEFLVVTAGLFVVWYLYRKNIDFLGEAGIYTKNIFAIAANTFLLLQISMEISNYFLAKQALNLSNYEMLMNGLMSISWSLYAVTIGYLGFVKRSFFMRCTALGMMAVTLAKLLIYDFAFSFQGEDAYSMIFNMKFLSTLIIVGAALALCWLYKTYSDDIEDSESSIFNTLIMSAIIVFGISITSENIRYFNSIAINAENNIAIRMQFGISSIWAIYSVILVVIGIIKRYKPARIFAMALFGITILKVFFSDLSVLTGAYRVLSFIILGFILLVVSFLYQKYKDIIIYDLPRENNNDER